LRPKSSWLVQTLLQRLGPPRNPGVVFLSLSRSSSPSLSPSPPPLRLPHQPSLLELVFYPTAIQFRQHNFAALGPFLYKPLHPSTPTLYKLATKARTRGGRRSEYTSGGAAHALFHASLLNTSQVAVPLLLHTPRKAGCREVPSGRVTVFPSRTSR
jgi:hypothetical protein